MLISCFISIISTVAKRLMVVFFSCWIYEILIVTLRINDPIR